MVPEDQGYSTSIASGADMKVTGGSRATEFHAVQSVGPGGMGGPYGIRKPAQIYHWPGIPNDCFNRQT